MNVRVGLVSLVVLLVAAGGSARAQYRYPPGYGGWNGWGGRTAAGDAGRGMGVFAAGAGSYNEQTAEARSINANTAMQADNYIYQSQQRRNQQYYAKMAAEKQQGIESANTIQDRLRNHPEPSDVHSGDALNIVLDDLTDPQVYSQAVQAGSQPIPGALVMNVAFEYAPQAITISLEDLTSSGVPDVLLTNPAFEADRTAFKALVTEARKEAENGGQISPQTMAQARQTITSMKTKVDSIVPDGPDREAADNYLKALLGLTKMLQRPDIEGFLQGLKQPGSMTSLGHLISFMNSFNLRFGVAKSPEGESAYDQLYPMLVAMRDQVNPQGTTPAAAAAAPRDPSQLTEHFSGMQYSHFGPQPDPHANPVPPAPAPGTP